MSLLDADVLLGARPRPARLSVEPARSSGASSWRPIVVAGSIAGALAVGITIWLGFKIGGETITTAVSDIGQAVPALAAAASCAIAAGRAAGRLRWAWGLLGASAASWGLGEVVWSYYTVVAGVAVPFPSAADVGFLGAVPFAVAGVLAFPTAPARGTTRARAVLDGALVALSLLFVSWALGLGQIYHQSQSSLLAQWIGLAYPIGDIVILTVLFVAYRRSPATQRGRLAFLVAGLAANAVSDSAFAFLTASGSFLTSSYLWSAGWIYGYSLVALAPLWPQRSTDGVAAEDAISLSRAMLPWAGLVAVVVTTVVLVATDSSLDTFLAFPGAGLVAVLMASQALSYKDSLALLAESRRAEARLQERTTMLNQVIDHAPQGVARVGLDRRITNTNPRLAVQLNATERTVVGSALSDFIEPDEVARVFDTLAASDGLDSDTVDAVSFARRADGSRFWLDWSVTAVRSVSGRIEFFLAMFDDVTARHEAEETQLANLAQLEKLNRLKSEFVSMVSHEFRTALVGIQGFSELLRDDEMAASEVHSVAADINNDAQRLNRMITEMLDLDRMEAGKIRLEVRPLDLNGLVRGAVERARMSTGNHTIKTELDEALPYVAGDPDRLIEVVTNLLSNAVKYSPDGGEIRVTTRLEGAQAMVSVLDHGRGIPTEFISRLFGRYERFEDKHAGKIIGTGLGLAITRQIVEMHGGRIGVESTVGKGSEFAFTIPLAQSPHRATHL